MKTLFLLVLGIFFLILQTTVFPLLPAWMGTPDFLFLFIVFIATHLGLSQGVILVFGFGLLIDIFSGLFLGVYPVIYLLLFFLIKGIGKHLIINEKNLQPALVAASYLFTCACIYIVSVIFDPQNPLPWPWGTILLETIILALLAIPCNIMFNWLLIRLNPKKVQRFLMKAGSGNQFWQ